MVYWALKVIGFAGLGTAILYPIVIYYKNKIDNFIAKRTEKKDNEIYNNSRELTKKDFETKPKEMLKGKTTTDGFNRWAYTEIMLCLLVEVRIWLNLY